MKTSNIKGYVTRLSRRLGTHDPYRICKLNQIPVVYRDLGDNYGYFCNYRRMKSITISLNIPPSLRIVVCAHELGHYFLHPDTGIDEMNPNSLKNTGRIERQANMFAVELLLSDEMLEEHRDIGLYGVGSMMGIPEELVELKRLSM